MPIITFYPSNKVAEVVEGVTLFKAAQEAGLPVASSCQANFVCGRCNMQVLAGASHLSSQSEEERQLLVREKKNSTDRISCRTKIWGDCKVTTTYW